jgi:tetratricopeptide (TPR) repeat protein
MCQILVRQDECRAIRDLAIAHFDSLQERPQFAAAFGKAWAMGASLNRLNVAPDRAPDPLLVLPVARRVVELDPDKWEYWHTLGIAEYRAGNYRQAIEALNRSQSLEGRMDGYNFFWLAMAHWQLGEEATGREWLNRAILWGDRDSWNKQQLLNYRREAEDLMTEPDAALAARSDEQPLGTPLTEGRPPEPPE